MSILGRPVSLIIAILIIVIHFGNNTPPATVCSKGFTQSVSRNFYHANNTHIIFNLVSVNMLSRVEDYLGTKASIVLLFLILFISSVLDFIISLIFPDLKCSIGFSGILFGLLAWEMMVSYNFNPSVLIILLINVITPTLRDPRASLLGHGIGAISGVLSSFLISGHIKK